MTKDWLGVGTLPGIPLAGIGTGTVSRRMRGVPLGGKGDIVDE